MKVYNPNAIGVTTGFGVPTGGTSGQVLQKVNSTNYNTQWVDEKSVTYSISETNAITWVKLGTWNTTQAGKLLNLQVTSHVGYNAGPAQIQVTDLVLSTSNGSSTQAGSSSVFYAAGNASINRLGSGDGVYASPSVFRIVQVSTTQYEVYGQFSSFGGGFYTVDTHNSDSWIADGSLVSAPSANHIVITPLARPHYISVYKSLQQNTVGTNTDITFDTVEASNGLTLSSNSVTLTGGKVYQIQANFSGIVFSNTSGGYIIIALVNSANVAVSQVTAAVVTPAVGNQSNTVGISCIYAPATTTIVKFRVTSADGTVNVRGSLTHFTITEIL